MTNLWDSCVDQVSLILQGQSLNNLFIPTNDEELKEALLRYVGIVIPDVQVCEDHTTPFRAFSDAFFARHSVAVWKASRGFGGKSLTLAALSFLESLLLGASVNLLGGSGEQSRRVHDYMTGEDTNLPSTFWESSEVPRDLMLVEPTATLTRLTNGGRIRVLTASQKSVRGPHPQRLRMDEIDEMELPILDAAMGQPMGTPQIAKQTVLSSTHQYASGTMTEILRRAKDNNWGYHEWCYKETSAEDSWLPKEEVESKRLDVTQAMWETEYDLQEPSPESRAIDTEKVKAMFRKDLGEYVGAAGEELTFEVMTQIGSYVTGADWARKHDWTVIVTIRVDVTPMRIVAFKRTHREPWPVMVNTHFEGRLKRFPGKGGHDATGLGDVVAGYLYEDVDPYIFVGRNRSNWLSNYISAIERGELICPHIDWMEAEHRLASIDDVYGSGHLPDSIAAMAIAYDLASGYTDYSSFDEDLGHVEDYVSKYA